MFWMRLYKLLWNGFLGLKWAFVKKIKKIKNNKIIKKKSYDELLLRNGILGFKNVLLDSQIS